MLNLFPKLQRDNSLLFYPLISHSPLQHQCIQNSFLYFSIISSRLCLIIVSETSGKISIMVSIQFKIESINWGSVLSFKLLRRGLINRSGLIAPFMLSLLIHISVFSIAIVVFNSSILSV